MSTLHESALSSIPDVDPRYDLTPDELHDIESQIVEDAYSQYGEGVVAVWIDPTHLFANFIRTYEANNFQEVTALDERYDFAQSLLLLVDTREKSRKVMQAATMMHMREGAKESIAQGGDETGFYTIDSLIKLGNFTPEEFIRHYEEQGIDLSSSVAAETNFKIHPKVERFNMLGSSDLVYLSMYNQLLRDGARIGETVVFATANDKQLRSLRRSGLNIEPLMGRTEFKTEEEDLGKKSMPVAIMVDEMCRYIFSELIDLQLPELHY